MAGRYRAYLHHIIQCERGLAAVEFVLIAPALLTLVFGIMVYSIYFSAVLGVRHAAAEGARAAVAGLSTAERTGLATARAQAVIDDYGSMLSAGGVRPVISAAKDGTGSFKVKVSYNMSASPIMRYAAFVPLPNAIIDASVIVTNGSY